MSGNNDSGKHIVIAGNIGSGKTTLVDELGARFKLKTVKEPYKSNPYLEDFYHNKDSKSAFMSQTWFLSEKLNIHNAIQEDGHNIIQDTSVFDVIAFAKAQNLQGILNDTDYRNYDNLYKNITANLKPPTGIIFLDVSIEEVLRRISERGRDFEKDIDVNYLMTLDSAIRDYISRMQLVMGVDIVFVNNPEIRDPEKMAFICRAVDRILSK